ARCSTHLPYDYWKRFVIIMAHRPKHRELRSENSKSRQDNSGCPQKLVLVSLAENDSSMGGLPNHAASSRIRTPELQTQALLSRFAHSKRWIPRRIGCTLP